MKPRGVSWILAVAVGIFVILAISLSIAELPDYSICLQQSKAAVYDWFSSSGLIDQARDDDEHDNDDEHRRGDNNPEGFPEFGGENLTFQAQAPSHFPSSGTEEDISVSMGGDNSDTIINNESGADNETSPLEGDPVLEEKVGGDCDVYSGSWVPDEQSYPLFQPFVCPFIETAFKCVENGRKNTGFLQWRWQPSGCNLPRFNATDMLRALWGKRLVFVGDSLGRNQWESLVCMLYQGISNRSNVYDARSEEGYGKARKSYTLVFSDYKVIIEYYRSHFLVAEGKRPPGTAKRRRVDCSLTLDRLEKTSKLWAAGDILVFNSGHWWTHSKVQSGKCYFIEGRNYTTEMSVMEAYEKSLRTWASWVDKTIGSSRSTKRVYFRGFAPTHFSGGDWDTGGTCDNHTQPLGDVAMRGEFPDKVRVVEEVLRRMKTPVTFLNVTYLSLFRKDGHVANWGRPRGDHRQDCSHWCLPGVPDTWNHLLYASLLQQ